MNTTTNKTTDFPAFDTGRALEILWAKASRGMDTQELRWFANGAGEQVTQQARHLETVLNSLALMAAEDGRQRLPSGSFQSAKDVPDLLYMLASQVGTLASLSEIADLAHADLIQAQKAE